MNIRCANRPALQRAGLRASGPRGWRRGRGLSWWTAWLLLAAVPACASAQALRVTGITFSGQPAQQAVDVLIISAQVPDGERRILHLNDGFQAGVELIAPARTVILFVSRNGNEVVLEPGARLRIADVTANGERYSLRAGRATFNVRNALSFFNVVFDEFVALVRGTQFSVLVDPQRRYRCEVERGAVLVERPERVRIGERETLLLAKNPRLLVAGEAGEHKAVVDWPLGETLPVRRFATLAQAEAFYLRQLEAARADAAQMHIVSGQLRAAAGRSDLALDAYARAERLLSPKDPRLGEVYALRAGALMQGRDFAQALPEFDKARAVYDSLYTPGASAEVADVLGGQADAYAALKDYALAERFAEHANAVAIAVNPQRTDARVALSYERLGRLAAQQGRYEAAARNYRFAIEVERKRSPDRVTPLLQRNLRSREALELKLRERPPLREGPVQPDLRERDLIYER